MGLAEDRVKWRAFVFLALNVPGILPESKLFSFIRVVQLFSSLGPRIAFSDPRAKKLFWHYFFLEN
jgi:hypothetical protein